jgi:hypothetical protein
MELFVETIRLLRSFAKARGGRRLDAGSQPAWPAGGRGCVVFREDTVLELGGRSTQSVSAVLWTCGAAEVDEGAITLVGPDFAEAYLQELPMGLVTIVKVDGVQPEDAPNLQRDLELVPFELDLKGFMVRSSSFKHSLRCRIGSQAPAKSISAAGLGAALGRLYLGKPRVLAFETLFVTSSGRDMDELRSLLEPAFMKIEALYRTGSGEEFDCASCDYRDACSEEEELRRLHEARARKTREAVCG